MLNFASHWPLEFAEISGIEGALKLPFRLNSSWNYRESIPHVNKTAVRFTVASREARAVVKLNGGSENQSGENLPVGNRWRWTATI